MNVVLFSNLFGSSIFATVARAHLFSTEYPCGERVDDGRTRREGGGEF